MDHFIKPKLYVIWIVERLSETAEDGHGNAGKTIRLIKQDKMRTLISEIKLTFVPSVLKRDFNCSIYTSSVKHGRHFKNWRSSVHSEGDAGVNGISAKEKHTG